MKRIDDDALRALALSIMDRSPKYEENIVGAMNLIRNALLAAAPAQSDEPAAIVESWTNGSYHRNYRLKWLKDVPEGTSLYAAANAPAKQEGWKLVPTKHEGRAGLTDAMMRAFYKAFEANSQRGDFERLNAGYNAMLDTAPAAPVPVSHLSWGDTLLSLFTSAAAGKDQS
jgi:hypothetical protein